MEKNELAAIGHHVCFDVHDMETNRDFNRDKFISKLIEDKEFLNKKDSVLVSFTFFLLNER